MRAAILEKFKGNKFIGHYIKAEEEQKELGLFTLSGWNHALCFVGMSPAFLAYKKQYKQASTLIAVWAVLIFLAPSEVGEMGKAINVFSAFYAYHILNTKFIKDKKEIFELPNLSDEEKTEKLKQVNSTSKESGFIFAGITIAVIGLVSYLAGAM